MNPSSQEGTGGGNPRRKLGVVLLILILVVAAAVLVLPALPSILRAHGDITVHIKITVSYAGAWSGAFSYGSPCPGKATQVSWNGTGTQERDVTFTGNWNSGFGYAVSFQKDDGSSSPIEVTVNATSFSTQTNSTAVPFGKVGFGACGIT